MNAVPARIRHYPVRANYDDPNGPSWSIEPAPITSRCDACNGLHVRVDRAERCLLGVLRRELNEKKTALRETNAAVKAARRARKK